jgi:hypothetical protein
LLLFSDEKKKKKMDEDILEFGGIIMPSVPMMDDSYGNENEIVDENVDRNVSLVMGMLEGKESENDSAAIGRFLANAQRLVGGLACGEIDSQNFTLALRKVHETLVVAPQISMRAELERKRRDQVMQECVPLSRASAGQASAYGAPPFSQQQFEINYAPSSPEAPASPSSCPSSPMFAGATCPSSTSMTSFNPLLAVVAEEERKGVGSELSASQSPPWTFHSEPLSCEVDSGAESIVRSVQRMLDGDAYRSVDARRDTWRHAELFQYWAAKLDRLAPVSRRSVWRVCSLHRHFALPTDRSLSFADAARHCLADLDYYAGTLAIFYGAIGYLKHLNVLKCEFLHPVTARPVFRTFIADPAVADLDAPGFVRRRRQKPSRKRVTRSPPPRSRRRSSPPTNRSGRRASTTTTTTAYTDVQRRIGNRMSSTYHIEKVDNIDSQHHNGQQPSSNVSFLAAAAADELCKLNSDESERAAKRQRFAVTQSADPMSFAFMCL